MTAPWTVLPREGRERMDPVASIYNGTNFCPKAVPNLVLKEKSQKWTQEAHRMNVR